jgi:hypothetical protein
MTGHLSDPPLAGQSRTLVRAGLKATRSAGSTKRISAGWIFARLFTGTRGARTSVKTSISGAPTLDSQLFPWSGDQVSSKGYDSCCIPRVSKFREYPIVQIPCHCTHLAQNSRMKIISEPPLPIEVYTICQNLSLEEVRPPAPLVSFSFIS